MNYGGHFDVEAKKEKVSELDSLINSSDFWNDSKKAEGVINEKNALLKVINVLERLQKEIISNNELLDMIKQEEDLETKTLIEEAAMQIKEELELVEIELLLDGEFDKNDVILEIHSGAGGTEANDWVLMLYRMYSRFFEKKGYKVSILSEIKGDEAGYKSVSIEVKGDNAYGYLKHERGVHRLIRISPFDSNSRRHTSFAFVDIMPLIEGEAELEVLEKDLKIDVYRSSGAGGQSVNTTDSAVRITHLPTGTVVTCQNERSQIRNREKALEILKNRLYALELAKKEESLKEIRGGAIDINFGSQIRSYVMHPYSMVKDHRTNTETSNVSKVMDGDIDLFINDNLKNK